MTPLFPSFASIRSPDPLLRLLNDPLVWGPVGAVLGVYLFFRGFSLLRRKRLVLNTPRSTVRAAALGPVELSGQADGPYTLVSPLSKTDCYYYRLVVTHVRSNQRSSRSVEECAPLFLSDGTGDVMLDPQGAQIQFPALATQDDGSVPGYLFHFLRQHGIATDDVAKAEEFCIRPQDQIVVFGTLQKNPWSKPQAEELDSAGRIGPGFLSATAADVQRRRAFESLDAHVPSGVNPFPARHFDLYPPVILGKGSSPFFISNCSQRELIQSLSAQSTLYIWGGPLLTLFCTYWLLQRLAGIWPR
ncbi:MAG TPA: hypothetical protein VJQ50_04435 [Terriglobales bacterium]|nr:hypothetical protein [Terriglobales bacterium]